MKFQILLFIFFSCPLLMKAQPVFPISTNNPDSINFSDLSFLKGVLKNVQIVGLGEQSHGDGATFDAKVRLIKYLHEDLGFNVIAFESGLYECSKANELIRTGESAETYLFKAIFSTWDCKEVKKLATYIDETKKSGNPLFLTGFDCQFAGDLSQTNLIKDFNRFVSTLENKTGKRLISDSLALDKALSKAIKYSNFFKKLSAGDTSIISGEFQSIFNVTDTSNIEDSANRYWIRVLNSLMIDYRRKFEKPELRDSMMAANALWLLKEKYEDQKIILWSANTHLAYNLQSVDSKYLSSHLMMGDYLKRNLGNQYYFMAFTSYEGKSKSGFLNLKVGKPAQNGIEQFFYEKGNEFSFANLQKPVEKSKSYFYNSKIFGHSEMKMNLHEIADGIIYIKRMYPANY